jgi:hypothetical protein
VLGLSRGQIINIEVPGTDRLDLSHTLPLWFDELPGDMVLKMISKSITEEADFWSSFGFKIYPSRENSPVQLPLNLLVCQGLIKSGQSELAGKVFNSWLDAASLNYLELGKLYSVWDSRTGSGLGKANLLESLFPIGQLLDLLGVRFLINGDLVIQDKNPSLYPMTLDFRGVEIRIEERETICSRSGEDKRIYQRGTEQVISF